LEACDRTRAYRHRRVGRSSSPFSGEHTGTATTLRATQPIPNP
jgi:hypothetical protein